MAGTYKKDLSELKEKELKWNVSMMGKAAKLGSFIGGIALACSIIGTAIYSVLQYKAETKRHEELMTEQMKWRRQETVTELKKELFSDSPGLRIGAASALADYSEEPIPLLIYCLREEVKLFTNAIKDSLKQIGKDTIGPLIVELKALRTEIINPLEEEQMKVHPRFPFIRLDRTSLHLLLNESLDVVKGELRLPTISGGYEGFEDYLEEEIKSIITKLNEIRSQKPWVKVARQNILDVLGELLRSHQIKGLQLTHIDFSGASLSEANLLGANLFMANLKGANLSQAKLMECNLSKANLSAGLSGANLSGADLSEAILSGANLSGANLQKANLFKANLSYTLLSETDFSGACLVESNLVGTWWKETNLSSANLQNAQFSPALIKFRSIKDFSNANFKGVTGLSKEDLDYAKSKGANIE